MKKTTEIIVWIVLLSFCIYGCEMKTEPVTTEVTFTLNISDFDIVKDEFGNLKSENTFDDFQHVYPYGSIAFRNVASQVQYAFETRPVPINEYEITLAVGTYEVVGTGGSRDQYGKAMMYYIREQNVEITTQTTEVNITIEPNCALILIRDEYFLVDTCYMEELYGSPDPAVNFDDPLYRQNDLYYYYLEPRDDVLFHCIKIDGSHLTMNTDILEIGWIYKINVAASDTTTFGNVFDPEFVEPDPINW